MCGYVAQQDICQCRRRLAGDFLKKIQRFRILLQELTKPQKELADRYAARRSERLSFGPVFKEPRTFFPLGQASLEALKAPQELLKVLDAAGWYCPDYREGHVYRKNDKLKARPQRMIPVLRKALAGDSGRLSRLQKTFTERLKGNRKQLIDLECCITWDPYDVAGMSTGRSWTSCMNLDDGAFRDTPLKQVQYGGMCAYLVFKGDSEIEKPIARMALKRFQLDGDPEKFIFIPETQIYGDHAYAIQCGFADAVCDKLAESNWITAGAGGLFKRNDGYSYSDSNLNQALYDAGDDQIEFMENGKFIFTAAADRDVKAFKTLAGHFPEEFSLPASGAGRLLLFQMRKGREMKIGNAVNNLIRLVSPEALNRTFPVWRIYRIFAEELSRQPNAHLTWDRTWPERLTLDQQTLESVLKTRLEDNTELARALFQSLPYIDFSRIPRGLQAVALAAMVPIADADTDWIWFDGSLLDQRFIQLFARAVGRRSEIVNMPGFPALFQRVVAECCGSDGMITPEIEYAIDCYLRRWPDQADAEIFRKMFQDILTDLRT